MGINPTPTNYKSFTFDGKSSRKFGVYTTGEGVFNAPERAVEMISIPARNGDYALDLGHFENIEVTYRCGIVTDNETDFAEAVSDFRNWLCSRRGYCRLEDEYNANEFRMGIFKSVVNVEHDGLETGELDVKFDCKPQRWLKSGETAVAVADGGTVTNPTLFDASPLLEVEGIGTINIGSQPIVIENVLIGEVVVANGATFLNVQHTSPQSTTFTIDDTLMNVGDVMTMDKVVIGLTYQTGFPPVVPTGGIQFISGTNIYVSSQTVKGVRELTTNQATFIYGTSSTFTATANCKMTVSGTDYSYTYTVAVAYDGNDAYTITVSDNASLPSPLKTAYSGTTYSDVIGNSTKPAIGNPTYIDLDIGEAWNEDSGEPVSVNNAVNLGSDLPTLPPGATTINYDNTITDLKIAPRWWKV